MEETKTQMIRRIEEDGVKVEVPIKIPTPAAAANQKQRTGRRMLSSKPVPKTKKQKLKVKINRIRGEWKNRKEKCMDFVGQLADGLEKPMKDVVRKVLELATDEDAGVKLPAKHEI